MQEITAERNALKRCAELRVGGRVGGDVCSGNFVDDWILRACKMRLIDGDLAKQFQSARADVGDFEQCIF